MASNLIPKLHASCLLQLSIFTACVISTTICSLDFIDGCRLLKKSIKAAQAVLFSFFLLLLFVVSPACILIGDTNRGYYVSSGVAVGHRHAFIPSVTPLNPFMAICSNFHRIFIKKHKCESLFHAMMPL